MSPTEKKTNALLGAFEEAAEEHVLTEDERASLLEAAADPQWIRLERGEAFERLQRNGS